MMNFKQVGTLLVWMTAGALVGAVLAFVQEVPPRQIPFWAVMGVLIVLAGKLIQLISQNEQAVVREKKQVTEKQPVAAGESVPARSVMLPKGRLNPDEAREWLDELLVKQQSGEK